MAPHAADADPSDTGQVRSESGATATEYTLLVFFIALAIVLGVMAFAGELDSLYQTFAEQIPTFG